jgi:hypothetical protein
MYSSEIDEEKAENVYQMAKVVSEFLKIYMLSKKALAQESNSN